MHMKCNSSHPDNKYVEKPERSVVFRYQKQKTVDSVQMRNILPQILQMKNDFEYYFLLDIYV